MKWNRKLTIACVFPFILLVGIMVWCHSLENKYTAYLVNFYIEQKAIYDATNGCVQCKLQDSEGYFIYTCNGTEYDISRLQWVNLNASICK